MSARVEAGDCRAIIPTLGVTVDAVVCDPPYDLVSMTKRFGKPGSAIATSPDHGRFARGFMGQQWDGQGVAFDPETWRIVGSALRPGGIILAFGAPRTHHRLASAIEDAGFVIQDCLMWLFATGFPKRRDMLKPAYEPIVMAYKPAGPRTLQIDECRISAADQVNQCGSFQGGSSLSDGWHRPWMDDREELKKRKDAAIDRANTMGRWPANICHDNSDEVVACFPKTESHGGGTSSVCCWHPGEARSIARGDSGSAARYFFSAKAGAQDRWGSKHPTVKPVELMKWLVQLVTPAGGLVLDPFAGSGTTGVAALATGRDCILIEREEEYLADIRERLAFYEGDGRHSMVSKARRNTAPRGETPLFNMPEAAE